MQYTISELWEMLSEHRGVNHAMLTWLAENQQIIF